jgi:hypothetical protein
MICAILEMEASVEVNMDESEKGELLNRMLSSMTQSYEKSKDKARCSMEILPDIEVVWFYEFDEPTKGMTLSGEVRRVNSSDMWTYYGVDREDLFKKMLIKAIEMSGE